MLRRLKEPSLRDRAILACARETVGRISEQDFLSLHNIPDSRYQKFYQKYIALMQHTTLYKIQRYLKRQEIDDVSLYFDYTDWLEEMGYDMKNKSNLYPKSFMKAHDKKSKEYASFKEKKNQEQREQFDKLLDRLQNYKYAPMFADLPFHTAASKEEFLDAVIRARTCADVSPIQLAITGKEMNINVRNSTTDYHEVIALQEDVDENVTIGFNAGLIINTLKAFEGKNVKIHLADAKKPMIMEAEECGFKALVLPIFQRG